MKNALTMPMSNQCCYTLIPIQALAAKPYTQHVMYILCNNIFLFGAFMVINGSNVPLGLLAIDARTTSWFVAQEERATKDRTREEEVAASFGSSV